MAAPMKRGPRVPDKQEPHPLLRLVDPERVPKHVAIIMDGNGRWAKARGLQRIEGHRAGTEAVRQAVSAASNLGVRYLTLYAFSVENWKRPASEVRALFGLLRQFLKSEAKTIEKNRIRFRTIGRTGDLPQAVQSLLATLESRTRDAGGCTLTLALSYGGRTEIADACEAILREAASARRTGRVTEEEVARHLYAPDLPDPDLLIRTSGEFRVSNFLLWQIAYAELAILDLFWPDFKEAHFYEAVLDYQRRERRYGGVTPDSETPSGASRPSP
jgi:undecaprenyl diphosphate synthase